VKPSDIRRRIWALSLPNILSNVTVPLLMLADTAMAGRMATADSIAAVAIGAAITQFVIGIWSLLRMGTTGFTAQAWGACDVRALLRQLTSGSIIALAVGLLLILLRPLAEADSVVKIAINHPSGLRDIPLDEQPRVASVAAYTAPGGGATLPPAPHEHR